jgi:hypothetical protein
VILVLCDMVRCAVRVVYGVLGCWCGVVEAVPFYNVPGLSMHVTWYSA